jgi:hypothetical protein
MYVVLWKEAFLYCMAKCARNATGSGKALLTEVCCFLVPNALWLLESVPDVWVGEDVFRA